MEVLVLLHGLLSKYDPSIDLSRVPDIEILGIQEDSRLVRTGDLFVARPGTKTDGLKFVADAHQRGAVAIITQQFTDGLPLPQIVMSDPKAVSILSHLYHGKPSTKIKVLGVTGTNGKTTTAYLIRHILGRSNQRCGMIGTVEIDDGRGTRESVMTTPGPVEIADLMAAMRDNACRACAIETSSHAMTQGRVAGVKYAAAGFTNLTGDHLDYHGTMEAYADAKASLFASLDPSAVACVNGDHSYADRMVRDCKARVVRFGIETTGRPQANQLSGKKLDYRARDIAVTSAGTTFVLVTPDGEATVKMQLIGRHNIENALCAASLVCETFGLSVHQVAAALADAAGAPGRLQVVKAGQKFAVLVDYAHTDDALENVLAALRLLTRGKLRVLFGCGGDRDRTKRPRMASVAQRLGDVIYVTSDNPRTESARGILDEIVAGFDADENSVDGRLVVEIDRRQAIDRIIVDAEDNDVVLLAGKGHENYQIIGTQKHHFDDVEEATRAIKRLVTA